jgi:hypothetical protein
MESSSGGGVTPNSGARMNKRPENVPLAERGKDISKSILLIEDEVDIRTILHHLRPQKPAASTAGMGKKR